MHTHTYTHCDDIGDKKFYHELIDLLNKIGGDLREKEDKVKREKFLSRQISSRKDFIIKEKEKGII